MGGDKLRRLFRIRQVFAHRAFWVAMGVLVCWVLYGQIGKWVVRPAALRQLRQMCRERVSMGAVEFRGGRHITCRDVVIESGDPADTGGQDAHIANAYDRQMIYAKEVRGRLSMWSLLRLRPRFKRITLRQVHVHAQYDADRRTVNLAALAAPAGGGGRLPIIAIEEGVLRVSSVSSGKSRTHTIIGLDGKIAPVGGKRGDYGFYLAANDSLAFAGSFVRGTWHGASRRIQLNEGRILMGSSPVLGNAWAMHDVALELVYDKDNIRLERFEWRTGARSRGRIEAAVRDWRGAAEYKVRIVMDDWLLTPTAEPDAVVYGEQALEVVGSGLRHFLKMYRPIGRGGLDVRTRGRLADRWVEAWTGTVRADDVSVCYARFPYTLEHLMGTLVLPETEAMDVVFDQLRCRHEGVNLVIGGRAVKVGGRWTYNVHLVSDNMRFDEDLRAALSARQQAMWKAFTPGGTARIDYRFGRDENGRSTDLLVAQLDGATATYEHFPYPLENLTGTVRIEGERITLKDVASRYDGDNRVITLNGHVEAIHSETPRFNMSIDANDVPIDATLRAALPERQRRFYEHFDVDAVTDAVIRVFPNEVGRRAVEYIADVKIRDASMVYRQFPLPLTNVDVDAQLTADRILLKRMTARHKAGRVEVSGDIWPVTDQVPTSGVCLSVRADSLELDEQWLSGLPEEAAKATAQLRPAGTINLEGTLNVNAPTYCEPFRITVECLGNSFRPADFPYTVDGVTGRIEITADELRLEDFRLPNLALVEGVEGILPDDARKVYIALAPAGVVDVRIDKARLFRTEAKQSQVDLAGEVTLKGCAFGDIGRVSDMEGVLSVNMLYAANGGLLRGDAVLYAESMSIKGRHFSDVRADIHYEPEEKRFTSRDFKAAFYGGKILGDADVVQTDSCLRYDVTVLFDGVQVDGMVAAARSADVLLTVESQGYASGSLGLRGTFGRISSNVGRLRMGIRQMKLAPRSLIGKVLEAMQLNAPSDYMFSDMSVDAFVQGGRLVLQEVYMSGSSNVLLGRGLIDLEQGGVNLEFRSYGTVVSSNPSFFETLARGLGAAIVRVDVSGTLDEPRIVTTPFPVLSSPLGLLGR